ncbi:MAG: Asp-tRNA(Asn)/Glu-tRNA(Gln) amidotransferase subunit GatC [bacterium]|nr:Asp-tRNA(Asn)/Glu-tRNA(Gln) amidotransferase subunit GatC [bacterium]
MVKLTKENVKDIAVLARLQLTEEEVERFQKQLSSILKYVEQLDSVDTNGIEATAHATGQANVSRNDLVRQANNQEMILSEVPDREGSSIRVKKVFNHEP